MQSVAFAILLIVPWWGFADATACAEGYTCHEDPGRGIVWVMKNDGNVHGPSCSSVCSTALCGSGAFHQCSEATKAPINMTAFSSVATGLTFTCVRGGCWNSVSTDGQLWVSIATSASGTKRCYFPPDGAFSCNANPGNANCFGERYSLVCPCASRQLDNACPWSCPPNNAAMATWRNVSTHGTSCLDRVNYWRKRACEEGWPECPPCGLPPMVECTACHACANSEAEYDRANGAHRSFKRCGERVQGEGGGATCADVIDAFVAERRVFNDSNGQVVCRGHCGPIVRHGCHTLHWGKSQIGNFYTLNWRSCDAAKCKSYCDNPGSNACFTHSDLSPDPDVCLEGTSPSSGSPGSGGDAGLIAAGILVPLVLIAMLVAFWCWRRKSVRFHNLDTKTGVGLAAAQTTHTGQSTAIGVTSSVEPPVVAVQLPPGWEEFMDEQTGTKYYYHASSGTSQWTVPTA